MIRLPGTLDAITTDRMVRLYGQCMDMDRRTHTVKCVYKHRYTVVDYSRVDKSTNLEAGQFYMFFGILSQLPTPTLVASLITAITHPIQWPLLEQFIGIVDSERARRKLIKKH